MEKKITRSFKYTDIQLLEQKEGKFVPIGDPIREYEGERTVREPQYVYAPVFIGEEKLSLPYHDFITVAKKYKNLVASPIEVAAVLEDKK